MKTVTFTAILTLSLITSTLAAEPKAPANAKKTAAKPVPNEHLLFKAYDKDQDEQLSEREFKKAPMIREADRDLIEEAFRTIDSNHDEAINLKEYLAGQSALKLLFRASDAVMDDGDRSSSAKEIKRILRDARS
jgi:hypothetical protein